MTDLSERVASIMKMGRGELRDLWRETFGEAPRSGNVAWMRKRLAWGVQAAVLGGLSDAAKQRIGELTPAALAWLPWGFKSFPERHNSVSPVKRDALMPGTVITRAHLGRTLELLVREDGRFELDGVIYPSLSAAAQGATGSHWNGRLFWFGRDRKTG
jgi:hypothetical protein